jgi:hypothetical protein
MKRTLLVLVACSVVLGLSSAVWAQTSHFWFDIRDNTGASSTKDKVIWQNQDITGGGLVRPFTNGHGDDWITMGTYNGGGKGDGQIMYIAPQHTSGYHQSLHNYANGIRPYPDFDLDGDVSTNYLWLYLDVDQKTNPTEVISSIGLDFEITGATSIWGKAAPKSEIESIEWMWEPLWEDTNAGKAMGLSGATGIVEWGDARAVKVPVAGSPPAFNTTNALTPNAANSPYRLGKLKVQAGFRNCAFGKNYVADSTWELNMYVDDLLITRVDDPANGDPGDESCSFGYVSGLPSTTAVDGSTAGAGGWSQIYIQVRQKWDGEGKGEPGNGALAEFINAKNAGTGLTQWQCFVFDSDGNRKIDNGDLTGLIAGKNERDGSPCP